MSADPVQTIWRDGALRLDLSPIASDAWLDYVSGVWFGPVGKRYQRRSIRSQIARFEHPQYAALSYAGKLVGSYLIDKQSLTCGTQAVTGFYRGLLSVDRPFQAQRLGAQIAEATLHWIEQQASTSREPVITYGCIDDDNERSIQLLQTRGMARLATLPHKLYYRQFKRRTLPSSRVDTTLTPNGRDWLAEPPRRDCLMAADPEFADWITLDDGQRDMIACRYSVNTLTLEPMTGVAGFVINRLMPFFPPGRRRFDPAAFRYVSLGDPINGAGPTDSWRALIEHLMVVHDCHFVALTGYASDDSATALLESGVFGRHALSKAGGIGVYGRWIKHALPADIEIRLAARDL